MNNAKLYSQYNHLQFRDAEELTQKFNDTVIATKNNLSSIDIGCGDGKVLVEVILKKLKLGIKKATGIDISKNMVEYAREKYEDDNLKFLCFNIFDSASDEQNMNLFANSVDVVTSFYTLMWVKELRKAFVEIQQLLKPGGYFIASILKTHEIYDAYCKAALDERYSEYLVDYRDKLPYFYHDTNVIGNMKKMLIESGFEILRLDLKCASFDYKTRLNYENSMNAVRDPFVEKIPENMKDEFMKYLTSFSKGGKQNNGGFLVNYEIVYIIATK